MAVMESAPIPEGNALDFSKTGIPWADTIIDIAVIGFVVGTVLYTAWKTKIHPMLKSMAADAKSAATDARIAKEEVKNTHSTNLRHDVDKVITSQDMQSKALEDLASAVQRIEESQADIRERISGLSEDNRQSREEITGTASDIREVRKSVSDLDGRVRDLER